MPMAKKVALAVSMVCGLGMIVNAAYPGWPDQRLFARWMYVAIGTALILVAVNQMMALRKPNGENKNNG
jgi:hypothetical protein